MSDGDRPAFFHAAAWRDICVNRLSPFQGRSNVLTFMPLYRLRVGVWQMGGYNNDMSLLNDAKMGQDKVNHCLAPRPVG